METHPTNGPAGWTMLQHQLEAYIEKILQEEPTVIVRATRGLEKARDLLRQLEEATAAYPLSAKEEVLYFKHVKPFFIGHVLFFEQLLQIETDRPPLGPSGLQEYYGKELFKLSDVYNDHRFIKNYLQFGSTDYDDRFFFRTDPPAKVIPLYPGKGVDGAFPVCYDTVVGQLIAADLLKKHLLAAIDDLISPGHAPGAMPRIIWTAPKAHLVELGYAFKAAKVFNNGNAQIKDIFECFELAFNVKVGNYGRIFQEVLYRHAGPTVAQDSITKDYLLFIQSLDDRHLAA